MPQPSPPSAKPETQATLATKKAEPTPVATKSQPTPAPVEAEQTVLAPKAKMEPTNKKIETMVTQIECQTTVIPTTAKVSPVTAEKQPLAASTTEPSMLAMALVQQTVVIQEVEDQNTDVSKIVTAGDKEEAAKMEFSVTEYPKTEESKPDISKVKVEAGVDVALPLTETTVILSSPFAAEMTSAEVAPGTETQKELAAPEMIMKKAQPDDHARLAEPTKSLQQVEAQPESLEPQWAVKVEPVVEGGGVVADKLKTRHKI